MKHNVILDVDTGIDDAIGIVLASSYENYNIMAISCCYGNSPVSFTTQNTLDIVNLIEKTEIPVLEGEDNPLIMKRDIFVSAHGKSGMGEYDFPPNKVGKVRDNAMDYLRDAIMSAKGKVSIVITGPCTNIAKLIYIHPQVKRKIKKIVISGGLLNDNKRKPYIGFNIAQDPYATELIFNSGIKTIICPSDFGHQAYLDLEDQEMIASFNHTGEVFKEIFKFYKDRHIPAGLAATHDACAIACCLEPSLFKFEKRYVYLRRVRAAGKSVIDFDAKLKKRHIKTKVACKIDVQKMKERIFTAFKKMP